MGNRKPRQMIITDGMLPLMLHHPQLKTCNVCNVELKSGNKIITKKNKKTKWYHVKCAERVNLI